MNRTFRRRGIALALASITLPMSAQALAHTAWGNPQPVVAVNSVDFAEGCPIESPDGRSLYIASNRPGGSGKLDIWRSQRSRVWGWGPPKNLGPVVNSAEYDYCPTPLRGAWLLFVTSNDTEADGDPGNDDCLPGPPAPPPPGSPAPGDIFLTHAHPFRGWQPPVHLGCYPDGPNTAGFEFSPSLVHTAEGTVLFFSSDGYPDSQSHDIYVSHVLPDGTVLPGTRVAELSTEFDDRMPNVRRNGLEIVFSSNRPGGAGGQDIYVASRLSTLDPWSAPQRIANPNINTAASETRASLSGDGTRLYFGRKLDLEDPGDIYVSRRSRERRGN